MEVQFISICSAFLYEWTSSLFNFMLFSFEKDEESDLGAAVEKCFADNHLN